MTTTPDNTDTTWRDLADQLTPKQVENLIEAEKRSPLPEAAKTETLLEWARDTAQRNLTDHVMFGHLEPPAGATKVFPCGERTDGRWSREFTGTSRQVGGVCVYIDGTQFADGTIERELAVCVDDLPDGAGGVLDAAQARALAAALIEAADELEQLQ